MSFSGESSGNLRPDAEPEDGIEMTAGDQQVVSQEFTGGQNGDLDEDLFGDGDLEEEDGEENMDESELEKRKELEYDDEHVQHLQGPSTQLQIAEISVHNIPVPHASDGKYWDLRLPNFIKIDPNPFSDQKFLEESDEKKEDEDEKDSSQAPVGILPDQNTIRWRWVRGPDGKAVKQSNARVVVWSDGSKSLQVGSELFDMVFIPDNQHQTLATPLSKPASQPSQSIPDTSPPVQGLTYLFARHDDSSLLEAQASITGQISLRPYSLDSLTHRSLVANRSLNKNQRQTRFHTVTVDPEKQKIEKELEEARKLKEEKKKENQRARTSDRQNNSNHDGAGARNSRKRKFNARLLSEEDDEVQEEDEYEEDDEEDEAEVEDDDEEEEDPLMDLDKPKKNSSRKEKKIGVSELDDERLDQYQKHTQEEMGGLERENQDGEPSNTQKAGRKRLIIFSEDEDE